MRILIDVDGVLLNTQEALVNCLNTAYGTQYTINDITDYHWFENTYKEIDPWAILEHDDFWFNEVEPIYGALNALNRFHKQGYEVYIVTSTQVLNPAFHAKMLRLQYGFGLTDEWLNKHMIIAQHKEFINGDILIDDNPGQVEKFNDSFVGGYAFMLKQPWNENDDNWNYTWEEIVDRVIDLDN